MQKQTAPAATEAVGDFQNTEPVFSTPTTDELQHALFNISDELRAYDQWVCWRLVHRDGAKPTKLPINARTGALASVTNPDDWCTFEEAVAAAPRFSGVGFVLTADDPFAFIDLDDTKGDEIAFADQRQIFEAFDSYSERSPSGHGLHIIVKANIPNGKRRGPVEVYSSARYMTMTGNVYHDRPIAERQALLTALFNEMGGASGIETTIEDRPERDSDDAVIVRASNAANGDKFKGLHSGNWSGNYPSQSEADQALVNIFAFYSKNAKQIARLFRKSALGQRDKANRPDYMTKMIEKAFDKDFSPVKAATDFSANFASNLARKGELKSNVFAFGDFIGGNNQVSYIWHHIFQRNYLYTITGMWGAGKSALAITVAIHAALGLPLGGHKMISARVLVLCGENPDDVRLRVRATCAVFGIDPTTLEGQLFFTRLPFAIDNQTALAAFIQDAARIGVIDLLIIDTGPAHSSADDENDNRQAHELAIAIRNLMDALGGPATVALMHPTKGATRETVGTSRGGGAFSGSVDGLCGVWRQDDGPMEFFHCNKFRGPGFAPLFLELQRHEFEDIKDNFDEPAISIVAVPTEAKPKIKVSITGSNRIALNALAECRHVAISPPQAVLDGFTKCNGQSLFAPFVVAPEALWRERCYNLGISEGEQSAKAAAFRRSRKSLLDFGLIHTFADHYWIPEWCTPDFANQPSNAAPPP